MSTFAFRPNTFAPITSTGLADGMKITLKALPGGLTVDNTGKPMLPQPFVFQCPPMDEFAVVRAFSFGNYDTVYDGQFTRYGSKQLKTIQFDTLAMIVGLGDGGRPAPGWVPNPAMDAGGLPTLPSWYAEQLAALHDSGAPFRFAASIPAASAGHPFYERGSVVGAICSISAVLTGYNEGYKAGETDAIYFEQVSFSEWRDPSIAQSGTTKPRGAVSLPTSVVIDAAGGHEWAAVQWNGVVVPGMPATCASLAAWFYGDATLWRLIARANSLSGGSANTFINLFPRFVTSNATKWTITIPARTHTSKKATSST